MRTVHTYSSFWSKYDLISQFLFETVLFFVLQSVQKTEPCFVMSFFLKKGLCGRKALRFSDKKPNKGKMWAGTDIRTSQSCVSRWYLSVNLCI